MSRLLLLHSLPNWLYLVLYLRAGRGCYCRGPVIEEKGVESGVEMGEAACCLSKVLDSFMEWRKLGYVCTEIRSEGKRLSGELERNGSNKERRRRSTKVIIRFRT